MTASVPASVRRRREAAWAAAPEVAVAARAGVAPDRARAVDPVRDQLDAPGQARRGPPPSRAQSGQQQVFARVTRLVQRSVRPSPRRAPQSLPRSRRPDRPPANRSRREASLRDQNARDRKRVQAVPATATAPAGQAPVIVQAVRGMATDQAGPEQATAPAAQAMATGQAGRGRATGPADREMATDPAGPERVTGPVVPVPVIDPADRALETDQDGRTVRARAIVRDVRRTCVRQLPVRRDGARRATARRTGVRRLGDRRTTGRPTSGHRIRSGAGTTGIRVGAGISRQRLPAARSPMC